jgi:hypothetical protein
MSALHDLPKFQGCNQIEIRVAHFEMSDRNIKGSRMSLYRPIGRRDEEGTLTPLESVCSTLDSLDFEPSEAYLVGQKGIVQLFVH